MAKPPKKIPTTSSGDGAPPIHRPTSHENENTIGTINISKPGSSFPDQIHPGSRPTETSENTSTVKPTVLIRDLADPSRGEPDFPGDMIIYRPGQDDPLVTLASSGLSLGEKGLLYARIEHIGDVVVSINTEGQFQIMTASAQSAVLEKVQGKSLWQTKKNGFPTARTEADASASIASSTSLNRFIVAKQLARTLTEADAQGLRHDRQRRTYADLENNTTVMVQREADLYRVTMAKELVPIGPALERIEGTNRWRVDNQAPGPAKRQRLEGDTGVSNSARPTQPANRSWEPNPYLWLTWGKPALGTTPSIEIDARHYPVLDFDRNSRSTVVIKAPEAGDTFGVLEQTLMHTPWRQPVAARRDAAGQWEIRLNPLFEKSLTSSVTAAFQDFNSITSFNVALNLFTHFNPSGRATSQGWLDLSTTLRHWVKPGADGHPGPTDPLQLLHVIPANQSPGVKGLLVPPVKPNQSLLRVDFNLRKPGQEPDPLATGDAPDTVQKFRSLLARNGYEVFAPSNTAQQAELVFKRENQLYFLQLQPVANDAIAYVTPVISDPQLPLRVGDRAYQALLVANEQNNIIWLAGTTLKPVTGGESAVIFRAPAPGAPQVVKPPANQGVSRPTPDRANVWDGTFEFETGVPLAPFALSHSRYAEQFKLIRSTWNAQNPFYPFANETGDRNLYRGYLQHGPASLSAPTSADNIHEKVQTFREWGMKIDIHSLAFFKMPGHVATEIINIDGGLIAHLLNHKQMGQPVVQRVVEPMAGSGFYSNFARTIGFDGKMIINDANPLVSWTQTEIVKQPDRVKHYIEFIKKDLIELGSQNNLKFKADNPYIQFKSNEEANAFSSSPEAIQFRSEVRRYFDETLDVVIENKNGKITITEQPPGAEQRAFLAAAFFLVQNNIHRNVKSVEIKTTASGVLSLQLPISVVISEGKRARLFPGGAATDQLNYFSYLHKNSRYPTQFLNEDGWTLLDNLRHQNIAPISRNDLVIISGHFSDTYTSESDFINKTSNHVLPLSQQGAQVIITNAYSPYKEQQLRSLGFHTFKKIREGGAREDYLLAINTPALQAAQSPD
jgi:hypothetical protein